MNPNRKRQMRNLICDVVDDKLVRMKTKNETPRPKFDDLLEPAELELRGAKLCGRVLLGVQQLVVEVDLLNDAISADGRDDAVCVTDAPDAEATV